MRADLARGAVHISQPREPNLEQIERSEEPGCAGRTVPIILRFGFGVWV